VPVVPERVYDRPQHVGNIPATIHPYTLELLAMPSDGQVIPDY
jgi:hypothetical protein